MSIPPSIHPPNTRKLSGVEPITTRAQTHGEMWRGDMAVHGSFLRRVLTVQTVPSVHCVLRVHAVPTALLSGYRVSEAVPLVPLLSRCFSAPSGTNKCLYLQHLRRDFVSVPRFFKKNKYYFVLR
ncbi:MAG: hypothetical protein WAS34_19005, partial [Thiolinea sp.]